MYDAELAKAYQELAALREKLAKAEGELLYLRGVHATAQERDALRSQLTEAMRLLEGSRELFYRNAPAHQTFEAIDTFLDCKEPLKAIADDFAEKMGDIVKDFSTPAPSKPKCERCEEARRKLKNIIENFWFTGEHGSPKRSWYEDKIFNEIRLYRTLGKEDARTVLAIWRRFAEIVEFLAANPPSEREEKPT